MRYIPFEKFTLISPLTIEEAKFRLKEKIHTRAFFSLSFRNPTKPYSGRIDADGFNIYRNISGRNSFIPMIRGHFISITKPVPSNAAAASPMSSPSDAAATPIAMPSTSVASPIPTATPKTRIQIVMRPNIGVLIFTGLWLGAVGAVCLGMSISFVFFHKPGDHFSAPALIPFAMFIFGYGLITLGFRSEVSGSRKFLETLFEAEPA